MFSFQIFILIGVQSLSVSKFLISLPCLGENKIISLVKFKDKMKMKMKKHKYSSTFFGLISDHTIVIDDGFLPSPARQHNSNAWTTTTTSNVRMLKNPFYIIISGRKRNKFDMQKRSKKKLFESFQLWLKLSRQFSCLLTNL